MPAIYARANHAWAAAIRMARARSGLTQDAFAKALKMTQQDVSKLETGRRVFKAPEIPVVAKAARMEPQELFDLFLSLYKA